MDAFLIKERDLNNNESQAADSLLQLLKEDKKVIVLMSCSKDVCCRNDSNALSFAVAVSRAAEMTKALRKAGFKVTFSQGFCKTYFDEANFSFDDFWNSSQLYELLKKFNLLVLIPYFSENINSLPSKQIEGYYPLSSYTYTDNVTDISITGADEIPSYDVVNLFIESGIRFYMLNVCEDRLYLAIDKGEKKAALDILEKAKHQKLLQSFDVIQGLTKLVFTGLGIKGTPGIMDVIYENFLASGIELVRTTDSHTTISCLIKSIDKDAAEKVFDNILNRKRI